MSSSGDVAGRASPLLVLVASLGLLVALLHDVASPGILDVARAPPPGPEVAAAPAEVVERYALEVELDAEAHVLRGRGTIELQNRAAAPLDHLFFHLYLNGFESERTVLRRRGGTSFRGAPIRGPGGIVVHSLRIPAWGPGELWPAEATTPGDPDDRTDIRVPLPRPIAPGEVVELAVAWTSTLPPVSLRTGYAGSFHMAAQWFPKLAKLSREGSFAHAPFERMAEFHADFADWDVTIRAPASHLVGATGERVELREEGATRSHRYVQRGVHDFAFTSWDGFLERSVEHRGVTLRCLHPAGYEEAARLSLEVARHGLDVLGERFGRYPYRTLTLVHPPPEAREAGGMEYPTLITTGGPWWGPLAGVRTTELVTIHELAHQWFQGLVATDEREHPFLDEGLTTFAEIDAMAELAPSGSAMSLALGLPLSTLGFYRARAADAARRAPVAQPARDFADGGDYGALVYGRTAVLLSTLDRVHDGAVRRALGVYARAHRFGHPTPEDLLAVVEAEAGVDAARALRQGLFERGTIDVSIRAVSSAPVASGHLVRVELERAGALELPVEIDVVDASGAVTRLAWDGVGAEASLEVTLAEPPRFVLVDPERRLLLDDDLLDGAWAARPAPPVAARTLGAGAFLARLLLDAVAR